MHADCKARQPSPISAVVAACLLIIADMPAAADDEKEQLSLQQEGDFAKPAAWMSSCSFHYMKFSVLHSRIQLVRRDERYGGAYTLSIAPESDESAVLSLLEVKKTGEKTSHVRLYVGSSDSNDDQSVAWTAVLACSAPEDEAVQIIQQRMQEKFRRSLTDPTGPYPAPDMPLDCCHDRTTSR